MANPNDRYLESINRLTAEQLGVLRTLTPLVGQVVGMMKSLKGGGEGKAGIKELGETKATSTFKQISGLVGTVGKKLGLIGAVVGTVVGAFTAVPLAVAGVVKASEGYVRAFNPALVEQYSREQENLKATIGYGLDPQPNTPVKVDPLALTDRPWLKLLLTLLAVKQTGAATTQDAAMIDLLHRELTEVKDSLKAPQQVNLR